MTVHTTHPTYLSGNSVKCQFDIHCATTNLFFKTASLCSCLLLRLHGCECPENRTNLTKKENQNWNNMVEPITDDKKVI